MLAGGQMIRVQKKVAETITGLIRFELGRGYKLHRGKYDAVIKNVVINLINCHEHTYCEWVAYSRDRNQYATGSRYNKLFIGYRPLLNVIDTMEKLHLVELVKGVNFPNCKKKISDATSTKVC